MTQNSMTKYMLRKLKKEIKDSNTSEARLVELMNINRELAFAVAEFGNISSDLIDELMKSPDNYLRDALSRNPNLTVEHLQTLCADDWLPARYNALRRLLHSVSEKVALEWFLDFLIICPDPLMVKQVKFHLINDARTPKTVLQAFAQDADEGVRQYVAQIHKEVVKV